jgi:hypothetical protein
VADAPDRLARVTIVTGDTVLQISRLSQEKLLLRLKYAARGNPVVDAFTAADANRPVVLTDDQKQVLREELERWAQEVTNLGLPPGIDELLLTLAQEANPGSG